MRGADRSSVLVSVFSAVERRKLIVASCVDYADGPGRWACPRCSHRPSRALVGDGCEGSRRLNGEKRLNEWGIGAGKTIIPLESPLRPLRTALWTPASPHTPPTAAVPGLSPSALSALHQPTFLVWTIEPLNGWTTGRDPISRPPDLHGLTAQVPAAAGTVPFLAQHFPVPFVHVGPAALDNNTSDDLVDACLGRPCCRQLLKPTIPDSIWRYHQQHFVKHPVVDAPRLLGNWRASTAKPIMTSPVVAGVKRSYATMALSWGDQQPDSRPESRRPSPRAFAATEGADPVYLPSFHTTPAFSAGPAPGGKTLRHSPLPGFGHAIARPL